MSSESLFPKPDGDGQNQGSQPKSNHKHGQSKPEKPKSTETKSRKRTLIVYEWLSILLLAVAGLIFFINHDLAVFSISLLLGGLLSGAFALRLALITHGEKHSNANTWCSVVAIPSTLLCIYLFAIETRPLPSENQSPEPTAPTIEEQIGYYSKLAVARQWQPPELPNNLPQVDGGAMVYVKFGGMTMYLPIGTNGWHNIDPFMGPSGSDNFTPYIKNNRLYVKTKTMFGDASQTVEMNNEWPATIPDKWDRNFNESSFEIVDNNTNPVFQIRYDAPNAIEIYGVFVAQNGAVTEAFGDETSELSPGLPIPKLPQRKAWFVYPSKNHLGELASQ